MEFKRISIADYIKLHAKNNPSVDKVELKKRLQKALVDYKNGVTCSCGDDIWVIGSASVGNSCFTCITGETLTSDHYEIESAINKQRAAKRGRHISEINPHEINGIFDDDGYEINTDLIEKPSLCVTCIHDEDPYEESLCQMTRLDQENECEFKCFAYKKRGL